VCNLRLIHLAALRLA